VTLYHYTCEHAARELGYRGMLRPNVHPLLDGARLVWLTDMDVPDRFGLGLTSDSLSCDRLNFRYVAVDVNDAVRWPDWCRGRDIGPLAAHLLESGGRQCDRWFVLERSALAIRDRDYVNPCPLLVPA
jgi:hypothetical protein